MSDVPVVIATRGLTKRYGRVLAVDGVDLQVRRGDIYGFLGPNGSGKTTIVRMLLGLVFPTAGEIEVFGAPVPARAHEVLPRIGAVVEGPAAYGHLSGRRNLALFDACGPGSQRRTRHERIERALDLVGLGGVDARPVKTYSLGMRQRLGLASALLTEPHLLILDEPTNGLDPRGIQEMRLLFAELNAAGVSILMSSHLLSEVEATCTRVGILDRGRLLVQEDLAALRTPTGRVVVHTPDADRAVGVLNGAVCERAAGHLVVRGIDPATLTARLVGAGVRVIGVAEERRSLEQVVLAAVGTSSDRLDRA